MDNEAFSALYWALQPQLLRHARFQLDDQAAWDVVSETFERLLRDNAAIPRDLDEAIAKLRPRAYAILRGKISNEYRSRRRRQGLHRALSQPPRHHVRDHAEDIAERSEMHLILGQLSPADREVILLFNAGCSTAEMAHILRCTPTAAARRRDRAKQRLRHLIEQHRKAEGDEQAFA